MKELLIFLFLHSSVILLSQINLDDYDDPVKITLKDGTVIYGDYKKSEGDSILVYNKTLGNITAHRHDVVYVDKDKLEKETEQSYTEYNYGNQYLISPTAFSTEHNYYKNTWVFIQTFGLRLSDHFSFSASFEPVSSVGSKSYVGMFNLKGSLPFNDNFHLAGGISAITGGYEIIFSPYIVGTIGNRRTNFTGGIYFTGGDSVEDVIDVSGPLMVILGTSIKVSRKLNLFAEATFTDGFSLANIGVRKLYTKSGIAFDLSLMGNGFGAFPMFSLYFPLDK